MRDSAVTGAIAGIAGAIFYQVFAWFFHLMGVSQTTPSIIGAYSLLNPGININNLPAQALGMAQHIALGMLVGIIAVYLLRLMGTDSPGIKGLILGGVTYLLIYGFLARAVVPAGIMRTDLSTGIVHLFGNLFFGLTTIFVAIYLTPREKNINDE